MASAFVVDDETPTLEQMIAELAAKGCTEAEIRVALEDVLARSSIEPAAFEDAMATGRALGRARVKAAQYEAALAGKVSAQDHVLARLGGALSDEEGESREFEVVRRIITEREIDN